MEYRLDPTAPLAAPRRLRERSREWLESERLRHTLAAAFVIVVPGGWAIWLAWYALRRRAPHGSS